MGKGSAKQQVTDYYMSIHYGISIEVDSIHGIYVGEKTAWEGDVATAQPINISKANLFGGVKKEGGVSGTAYFLPGRQDQVLPEYLAGKVGRTSLTAPAYRGVSSVWFTGRSSTPSFGGSFGKIFSGIAGRAGFLWGSNNPYLRDIWMRVRRSPKGLGDTNSQMLGTGKTVSVQRNSVTVDGATGEVVQGTPSTIGGTIVTLNRKSLKIGGTEIIVNLDQDSNSDPKNRNPTVSVGGIATPLVGSNASVNGWTISVNSSYAVSLGAGSIRVANFTARQNVRIDANPVHIIYECMTNPDWGMGGAPSSFDLPVWLAAAKQIFDESFGMSLVWAQQSTVEAFVGEIVDHIQATIFINPRNGLWTIKLIRDDYNVDTLPILNTDNCRITNFERKAWGETTNEIVVTWTNPVNEQDETVIAQDLANITIQGSIVSDSRNYYGVRSSDLAMRLAMRDLRLASSPIAIFELEVDRNAWDFVPGGVVVLDYDEPDYEISKLVLRISKIDYGRPGDLTIKINASEDIFSLPVAAYGTAPSTEWQDSSEPPRPLDFSKVITTPLYFATNAAQSANIDTFEFPSVMTMVLGAQSGDDTYSFDLLSEQTDPNGGRSYVDFGTMGTVGRAVLGAPLGLSTTSFANFNLFVGEQSPVPNAFALIGSGGEQEMEIALVSGYDPNNGFILQRGVLDTVPRAWPTGTPVWFVLIENNIYDESPRAGGETVKYKMLPRTSQGMLDPAAAPVVTTTLTNRPWLPNRPGNVKVGGVTFGTIESWDSENTVVTWANRNRLMEPTQVVRWTDASVTPEVGQTSKITIMRRDRTVIKTYTDLTGTSFALNRFDAFGAEIDGIVRVTAERDDLESLQGHEIIISWGPSGYGRRWGTRWGS